MKLREWWMLCCPGLPDYNYRDKQTALDCATKNMDELVHVIELPPGHIVVSRQYFEAVCRRIHKEGHEIVGTDKLADELFGETTAK